MHRSFLLLPTTALVVLAATGCVVHERRAPETTTTTTSTTTVVDSGGAKHPAYLHALSDLRNARANIERKGGDAQMKWDEHDAVAEIDRAIAEIKQAAIDDGKNLDDHPPVDAHEPRVGRLHKGLDALRAARHDVDLEEDNAFAGGLRARAQHHIDEALRFTEAGIQAAAAQQ